MNRLNLPHPTTLLVLIAAACGGEPASESSETSDDAAPTGAEAAAPDRQVRIVAPADGDTLDAGPVTVRLESAGFQVVPAGDMTPNSGHHHLFLDRDPSPAGQPIPAEEGHIVHMGTGTAEFTFEAVEAGEHRLIAVVGDAVHVPLDPPVTDTISFVVR